jgi:hypothetical protein
MKKLLYSLLFMASAAVVFSCEDEELDPMQLAKIKKGTILALRGTQLNNIYFDGVPGAEFFPRIMDGTEKFEFDAEFLSEDVSTLESFDIYVIKKVASGTERVHIKNVPGSEFKQTDDYLRPWVSVSMNLTDIVEALGLDFDDPATVNTLLTTYKFGINIESDLNLTDGSIIPAAEIVAAGLFQSDQFYPAQILTYTVTDYCPYDASTWGGNWIGTETPGSVDAGKLTQDGADPNKYIFNNWWGDGVDAYFIFTPSTVPSDQIVTVPKQTTSEGGEASGVGTYNQCLDNFTINAKYVIGGGTYEFIYSFKRP